MGRKKDKKKKAKSAEKPKWVTITVDTSGHQVIMQDCRPAYLAHGFPFVLTPGALKVVRGSDT